MATMEKDPGMHEVEYIKGEAINTHNRTGDVDLLDGAGHVRRIPIPSNDPNDPLNMWKFRKLGVIVTCCWYSIFSLVLVGGAGPILPSWFQLYAPSGHSTQQVVNLTTYPSLVMAFGAFIMLPLAMTFGRRPVMIGCCILIFGSTIGAAQSNSYETHMACRILQGIATGATESVLPLIITDISFLDERGVLFGVYWGTQNLIGNIFTVTVSYLVAETSWRWFYYLLTIMAAIGMLLVIFIMPETMYHRSPTAMNGEVWFTDEFGVTRQISDTEARERFGATLEHTDTSTFGSQKTYLQSIKPYSGITPNAWTVVIGALGKMAASLSSPAVVWAILASSINLGVSIAMSLTYGTVLTEGFGWTYASVGLINCGVFPAALLSMFFAGYLGDKLNLFLAKRNGGTHKPEHVLVTLVFPVCVSAIGTVIYGVTANHPEKYSAWGIIMGWTLYNFGFIVCLITATHFAAEAYPQNPGPALVVVVGAKNIVSFAASYGIIPLVHKSSYQTAFMVLFGVFVGLFLLGIPVYFLNPKWRAMVARKQKV